MFKYFIGNVYILEKPRNLGEEQVLDIEIPTQQLLRFDDCESYSYITDDSKQRQNEARKKVISQIGADAYRSICVENQLRKLSVDQAVKIIDEIKREPSRIDRLKELAAVNLSHITSTIEWIQKITGSYLMLDGPVRSAAAVVLFIESMHKQWNLPFKLCLENFIRRTRLTVEEYFQTERYVTYDFTTILSDLSIILQGSFPESSIDLQAFIDALSSAFLPMNVFLLEEYGLPRMLSQRIHQSGILDMTQDVSINRLIHQLKEIGYDNIVNAANLEGFDLYILRYFFAGI